jgi:hypothetical protein
MKYESQVFRKEQINYDLAYLLGLAGSLSIKLDNNKRCLFYEKMPTAEKTLAIKNMSDSIIQDGNVTPVKEALKNINPRLLHAILGLYTELGEMIHNIVLTNGNVDEVNMVEEAGDLSWYFRLLAEVLNTTPEKIIEINQAKLDARYGAGQLSGSERDLEKERQVLEAATQQIAK